MKLLPMIGTLCLFATGHAAALPRSEILVVSDDVADPATMNPYKEFVEKNHTILQQIFDGLFRINADGAIEPALAVQWRWTDNATLEIKLREGVSFHNGEHFDAEAVKFSIEQYLDPRNGFPALGYLASIKEVQAVDALTVRIKTNFPDGILLNKLAALILITPPKYVQKFGADYAAAHPIGTGAFRFVQWEKGKQLVLDANENYWRKGYPQFKRLVFRFLPPEAQVAALLKGDVDIVTELPGTNTLQVTQNPNTKIIKKLSYYTVAGSVNISSGPLVNLKLRQALNYALDKEEFIRYDLLGNGTPLATMSMPGEIGHNPDLRPYPHDVAKARQLVKEAGYPKGVKLRLIIKYQTERSAKILAKQLEEAGIHLDIHQSPDSTLSQDIQNGHWDFTFGGCPDPLSHSFFVQSIFLYSRSPFSIMRNPEYDALLNRMVSTLDLAEQQRIGMEVDRYVYEQALSLFTYQKIRTYGVKRSVRFVPPITGMPYFYDVGHATSDPKN